MGPYNKEKQKMTYFLFFNLTKKPNIKTVLKFDSAVSIKPQSLTRTFDTNITTIEFIFENSLAMNIELR